MRLTLRTLLAWLDDTLPPSQVREIGKQVADTPYARELIERIHRVSRQRRHTVPKSSGPEATDPNIVAGYVDNGLEPDVVAEYEKKCLTSDVNLAEVASVHQILSLLGQKVHVPPETKSRMYHLVRGRESSPPPRSGGYKPLPPEPVTKPIQPWVAPLPTERHWVERFGPLAGCLALIGILCWSAYESMSPPPVVIPPLPIPAPVVEPVADVKQPGPPAGEALVKADGPGLARPETPAVPEPNMTTTTPEPAPTTPAPSAPARAVPAGAVGVVDKVEGLLLRFHTEKREWVRVTDGAALEASDRLVCPAPFRARVVVAKAPMTLVGETHLKILSKDVSAPPAIELTEGRVILAAASPVDSIKVEYSGRTVTIEHPSETLVGLDRTAKWVYGQSPPLPPGLSILANQGEVKLTLDPSKETLKGPGIVVADANGQLHPSTDTTLPEWLTATATPEQDLRAGEQFLQQFAADRPILADMVAATGTEASSTKRLAIMGVKALGDLSLLTPILGSPGDRSARQSAIEALRSIVAQGPQARKRLREQIDEDLGVELGLVIDQMLVGSPVDEATKKRTLTELASKLLDPSLIVRELAIDNLKTITGRGDLAYDPDKPDEKAVNAWKAAVSKETAKAAVKRKNAS